jgi:hypothetical protein
MLPFTTTAALVALVAVVELVALVDDVAFDTWLKTSSSPTTAAATLLFLLFCRTSKICISGFTDFMSVDGGSSRTTGTGSGFDGDARVADFVDTGCVTFSVVVPDSLDGVVSFKMVSSFSPLPAAAAFFDELLTDGVATSTTSVFAAFATVTTDAAAACPADVPAEPDVVSFLSRGLVGFLSDAVINSVAGLSSFVKIVKLTSIASAAAFESRDPAVPAPGDVTATSSLPPPAGMAAVKLEVARTATIGASTSDVRDGRAGCFDVEDLLPVSVDVDDARGVVSGCVSSGPRGVDARGDFCRELGRFLSAEPTSSSPSS